MINTVAEFLNQGGMYMWVILSIGGIALAVTIERMVFYLVTCKVNHSEMVAEITTAISYDSYSKPKDQLKLGKAPVHKMIHTALERYAQGFTYTEIQQGVEEVALSEVPRFAKRLNNLGMCANIATLTGLLGTIFGLQVSFSSLQLADGAEKATALANGIAVAMNTTAMGLIVAIPCMVAFTQLSNLQTKLTEQTDEVTVKILNFIEQKIS